MTPYFSFLLTLICLINVSCVYFNTFYNAEASFKKALKIIEESPILDNDELPSQATKLLGDAIDNSQIVLNEYSDSKFVDDAIYIIAISSLLRNEVAIAESYFNQLLNKYPDSKFHSLSEAWLAYTHFHLGLVDSARSEIKKIKSSSPKNKENLKVNEFNFVYNMCERWLTRSKK